MRLCRRQTSSGSSQELEEEQSRIRKESPIQYRSHHITQNVKDSSSLTNSPELIKCIFDNYNGRTFKTSQRTRSTVEWFLEAITPGEWNRLVRQCSHISGWSDDILLDLDQFHEEHNKILVGIGYPPPEGTRPPLAFSVNDLKEKFKWMPQQVSEGMRFAFQGKGTVGGLGGPVRQGGLFQGVPGRM